MLFFRFLCRLPALVTARVAHSAWFAARRGFPGGARRPAAGLCARPNPQPCGNAGDRRPGKEGAQVGSGARRESCAKTCLSRAVWRVRLAANLKRAFPFKRTLFVTQQQGLEGCWPRPLRRACACTHAHMHTHTRVQWAWSCSAARESVKGPADGMYESD